MGGVLQGFLFFKVQKPARLSDTNGRCIAANIGGVLQYFVDMLYGLGVLKHCPSVFWGINLVMIEVFIPWLN